MFQELTCTYSARGRAKYVTGKVKGRAMQSGKCKPSTSSSYLNKQSRTGRNADAAKLVG